MNIRCLSVKTPNPGLGTHGSRKKNIISFSGDVPTAPEAIPMEPTYDATAEVNPRSQAVNWCFTLNNYTEDEVLQLSVVGQSGDVKYLVYGKEKAPTTGTLHLQCFIQMRTKKRFAQVKALLPVRCAQIGQMYRRSNALACSNYCKKDGDFTEYGTPPLAVGMAGRARQTHDYEAAVALAVADKLEDVRQQDAGLYVRHYRTFKMMRDDAPRVLEDLSGCCGLWIYGPSNTGKSHWARQKFGADGLFVKSNNKWWDKYQGEPHVLIEDLDFNHVNNGGWSNHLKIWPDKYPFDGEVKGSTIRLRPQSIIVTSNYTIQELFECKGPQILHAIEHRFKVFHFSRVREGVRPHVLDELSVDEIDLPDGATWNK